MNTKPATKKKPFKPYTVAIAADIIVFGYDGEELSVLLILRKSGADKGKWALPGGFLREGETMEACAHRELGEETNAQNVYLEQFKVYSAVDRDPRRRVLSVAYIGLVRKGDYQNVLGGTDAREARWFPLNEVKDSRLAFDHEQILTEAYEELKRKLRYSGWAFRLLDEKFTIRDLQNVCRLMSGRSDDQDYDSSNFLKKLKELEILQKTQEQGEAIHGKRPYLYELSKEKYEVLMAEKAEKENFPFDL